MKLTAGQLKDLEEDEIVDVPTAIDRHDQLIDFLLEHHSGADPEMQPVLGVALMELRRFRVFLENLIACGGAVEELQTQVAEYLQLLDDDDDDHDDFDDDAGNGGGSLGTETSCESDSHQC